MATQAKIAYGYVLSNCSTSGGTFVPIVEIVELKPGKKTTEKVKVQSNSSPSLYGEQIPGWQDESDWEVKCIYEKGKKSGLEAINATPYFWKFIRPDGTSTSAFAGFISELGDEVPLKESMTMDFKITVNGSSVFSS